LGTAIALPVLESMIPTRLFGDEAKAAAKAAAAPKRVAWLYVPNGIHMPNWTPSEIGPNYQLTPTLQPLAAYRDRLMVMSGLVCDKANPNGDGPGDHARAMSAYLTGAQPRKTEGANLKNGISADQAAADKVGHLTKFRSLELGMEEGKQIGRCDSGYSCAYSHTLSWRSDTTPVVKDCDPRSVFDRLFSNVDPRESAESRARRENDRKSILDFVLDDANRMQGGLGYTDRQKMDEYLTAVREIEVRLAKNQAQGATPPPAGAVRPTFDQNAGTRKLGGATTNDNYVLHLPLMLDMMVLAFQTDLTRVITLPFANEGSNQTYPWGDAPVPHHGTSHHSGNAEKQAMLARINRYHITHLAYLLDKLERIQEGHGTLLDNSLIAYGSGNSDGQRHNHDNLPILLCGRGGGTVVGGRHLRVNPQPVNNLWLTMLDRVGDARRSLGDSTGKLDLA
jgi:hypothetical protein